VSNFLFLVLGLALLTAGGEALIRGALAAAKRLGVSPLLSGLVIVGFGTSMPELVVSVNAALENKPDIAIGNVVGSNIGNILLILGICALITPMAVKPLALHRDAVSGVAASLLFLVLVGGSALGRADGVILLMALGLFLFWAYWSERFHAAPSAELHKAESEELSAIPHSIVSTIVLTISGLLNHFRLTSESCNLTSGSCLQHRCCCCYFCIRGVV
jgi:cation:H+ antiporter